MDGGYGNDYIIVTDDTGNEFELEHLDTAEVDGELYMLFLPADMDESDEDYGHVILKVVQEGEEEVLVTVDDENELDFVYAAFAERFSELPGED